MTDDYRPECSPGGDVYDAVCRAVAANTHNTVQGPLVPRLSLLTVLGHSRHEPDAVHEAIDAAVEHDDILVAERAGRKHYALAEPERLRAVIEKAVAETPPDRGLVAECNRLIHRTRD